MAFRVSLGGPRGVTGLERAGELDAPAIGDAVPFRRELTELA